MDYFYLLLVIGSATLLSWPLGYYLKVVMDPEGPTKRNRILVALLGTKINTEKEWKGYLTQLLSFNFIMFLFAFIILSVQQYLFLNPDDKGPIEPFLIFNTAISFTSNTNLQHYSGEVTMSYLSQIGVLMWLQFVSAATGLAALTAMSRLLSGRQKTGNFIKDLGQATFFILLPLSLITGILLALIGIPMTWEGAAVVQTLEGISQTIARGPVAAFVAIKQLGTNGGGFFGTNSTHPFENPNFYTNFVEMLAIILLPMACVWMFGRIIKRIGHAQLIFGLMLSILVFKGTTAIYLEQSPSFVFSKQEQILNYTNLEGKELRFGEATGPLWSALTTSTSNGSVGSMHNSLNPLTLLVPFSGMWLNTTFGGVGVGMINFMLFIIIGVFISGLMVGRTPEYLGRKVETKEMKFAALAILLHPICILGGTALFAATSWGLNTIQNPSFRGFSEILYEFSSASANNGSGLEGLSDNTIAWNIATGLAMLFGRFIPMILPIAIAGSLAKKNPIATSPGTLSTDNWSFAMVLVAVILLVGALLFLPVAVLGPIAEYVEVVRGS
jgi:potassium-transporting ATPase potassium-binding subunit